MNSVEILRSRELTSISFFFKRYIDNDISWVVKSIPLSAAIYDLWSNFMVNCMVFYSICLCCRNSPPVQAELLAGPAPSYTHVSPFIAMYTHIFNQKEKKDPLGIYRESSLLFFLFSRYQWRTQTAWVTKKTTRKKIQSLEETKFEGLFDRCVLLEAFYHFKILIQHSITISQWEQNRIKNLVYISDAILALVG